MRFILTALILTFATQVAAGYINDRNEWNKTAKDKSFQAAYAMGAFDQITQKYHGAKKGWGVWIKKINKCALEMKFTGHDLADLINSHYQDLENWQHSANVALQEGLVKVCKTKK